MSEDEMMETPISTVETLYRKIERLEVKLKKARISALEDAAKAICPKCAEGHEFVRLYWPEEKEHILGPANSITCKAGNIHDLIIQEQKGSDKEGQ